MHFTLTWINLFAEITGQQIRRGVFKRVAELAAAIETSFAERNAKPKPFRPRHFRPRHFRPRHLVEQRFAT
jgi:hypothetical protein